MSPLLRALIVEDEWPARQYLAELLAASGRASVVGATGNVEEARRLLSTQPGANVDVVFVDIHLAGQKENGLSLVRQWTRTAGAPAFVLTTAHKQHALEAFDLGVGDYLVKPLSEERLAQCLDRLSRLPASHPASAGAPERMVARRGQSLFFLETAEIWAVEAVDRLTRAHTGHGVYELDLSLQTLERILGSGFLRVHRNWLVQARSVRSMERVDGGIVLCVGPGLHSPAGLIRVPVAKSKAQTVRSSLVDSRPGIRKR